MSNASVKPMFLVLTKNERSVSFLTTDGSIDLNVIEDVNATIRNEDEILELIRMQPRMTDLYVNDFRAKMDQNDEADLTWQPYPGSSYYWTIEVNRIREFG